MDLRRHPQPVAGHARSQMLDGPGESAHAAGAVSAGSTRGS